MYPANRDIRDLLREFSKAGASGRPRRYWVGTTSPLFHRERVLRLFPTTHLLGFGSTSSFPGVVSAKPAAAGAPLRCREATGLAPLEAGGRSGQAQRASGTAAQNAIAPRNSAHRLRSGRAIPESRGRNRQSSCGLGRKLQRYAVKFTGGTHSRCAFCLPRIITTPACAF